MGEMGHIVACTVGYAEEEFQQSISYYKPLGLVREGQGDDDAL